MVNCEEKNSFLRDPARTNVVAARILRPRVKCVRYNLNIPEWDQSNGNRNLPVTSEYDKSSAPLNPEACGFKLVITV